jgi:hypothetical protein
MRIIRKFKKIFCPLLASDIYLFAKIILVLVYPAIKEKTLKILEEKFFYKINMGIFMQTGYLNRGKMLIVENTKYLKRKNITVFMENK